MKKYHYEQTVVSKGIVHRHGKYKLALFGTHLGTYDTLVEAVRIREDTYDEWLGKGMWGWKYLEHPLYTTWRGIVGRCHEPSNKEYFRYGAKGIKMCELWRNSFTGFLLGIGDRPSKNHTIDRIDNDKGYYKENCRWATHKEQANNRRPRNSFQRQ